MAATNTLVPDLRFPEFRDDWNLESLSEVLREHKRKNKGGCDVFSVSQEMGLVNQIEHLGRSFSAKDTSNYNKVAPHDIVYTKSPLRDYPYGIVKQSKLGEEVAVSPLYGVFAPLNKYLGAIIEAHFESPYRSKTFIGPLAQKGAKNTINITNATFLSGKMALPTSPAEQQKIADCLGSLDDLIAVRSRKLTALQDHKKGLLQQPFPAECETTPKLRFSEFEGEWKEIKLRKCVKLISGLHLAPEGYGSSGSLPYFTGPSDFTDSIGRVTKWTDRAGNAGNAGDTLITVKGSGSGTIWRLKLNQVALGRQLMAIRPTKIDGSFLFFFLAKKKQFFEDLSLGNLIPGLSRDGILDTRLLVPEPPEQQKIANCLSALDTLITAQTEQIAALKAHKQGLMQKLFPNPELSKA